VRLLTARAGLTGELSLALASHVPTEDGPYGQKCHHCRTRKALSAAAEPLESSLVTSVTKSAGAGSATICDGTGPTPRMARHNSSRSC